MSLRLAEQSVKPWMLILSGQILRQGVFQVFQSSSEWNPNSSRWNCNWPTLIPARTPIAFTLGGDKTVNLWILNHNGCNPSQRVFQLFQISSEWFPNSFRWHSNQSTPSAFTVWENWLSSHGCWFSVNRTWGLRHCKCFNAIPNEIQTVPDRTATDLLWFLSRLPVLLCWAETRLSSHGFWSLVDTTCGRGIARVPSQFLQESKQFKMELWQIYSHSHLDYQCFYNGERKDCQTVGFNLQWMECGPGDIPVIWNQFLMKSKQVLMELWHIYSPSCLDAQCFYIGGRKHCQGVDLDSQWIKPDIGVLQVFQSSSWWNPNSSTWNCDWSTLIAIWTDSALRVGGEHTVKLWILILTRWNLK